MTSKYPEANDPRFASLEEQYRDMLKRDLVEFRVHYYAISKAAGRETESHAEAVMETAGGFAWVQAYKSHAASLLRLVIAQAALALALKYFNAPEMWFAVGPMALTLVHLAVAKVIGFIVFKGADIQWNERSFAMQRYLTEVFKLDEEPAKESDK